MKNLVTKKVGGITYYLGKNGRWEGLKDNAVIYHNIQSARKAIDDLRLINPKGKFDFTK